MAGRLNRHLGRMVCRCWNRSTDGLALQSTILTCRTMCSYFLAGKVFTVDARNNCNKNKHVQSCSWSASDKREQWTSRVKRHMSTGIQDTNICQARLRSCDSSTSTDLVTFLATSTRTMGVQECCDRLEETFRSCGVSEPDQSAQYIVAHVLGHKTVNRIILFHCVNFRKDVIISVS